VGLFIFLVVVVTTIWVAVDASNIGMTRGRMGGGSLDMGPASWFFCCLLLWIVAFPCYLIARSKFTTLASSGQLGATANGLPGAHGWTPPPAGAYGMMPPPPMMPVQFSADGRWYWAGQSWLPVPSQAPPVGQPLPR
jgi:hypothetical protein